MIDEDRPDIVLWQSHAEDAISWPAILLKRYADTLQLSQEGRYISLNPESVPELVRALRKLQPAPKERK